MKKIIPLLILAGFVSACVNQKLEYPTEKFTAELAELKEYFSIPGLAVSIEKNGNTIYRNYLGVSDIEQSTKVNAHTLFPIASITKVFSGILVMKLSEQEKLSLDDPINAFLPKPLLGDSVKLKHILSHTSQGNVGQNFYYSSRFGLITHVIEKAAGKSFSEVMKQEILNPLKLNHTFLLKDSTQIEHMAKPHMLEDGITSGFVDYGYSSSAGIVSNLDDLKTFNEALDSDLIISSKSKEVMFSSSHDHLPYGYGIFDQQFENLNIVWAYGQYDCYSSLLLKIPSQKITLTILANNSLLSDPARLIYGDVTSSLFALSFLKNYVWGSPELPLFENEESLTGDDKKNTFRRKKILAQALADAYMARYDPNKMLSSSQLLNHVFSTYPNYLEYADLNLLHNLSFLKDVAFYMELGAFNDFDVQIETIGAQLLKEDPNNPYTHTYLGTFYARRGDKERARYHFESIVNAKNFAPNWYTREARQWLDENL